MEVFNQIFSLFSLTSSLKKISAEAEIFCYGVTPVRLEPYS